MERVAGGDRRRRAARSFASLHELAENIVERGAVAVGVEHLQDRAEAALRLRRASAAPTNARPIPLPCASVSTATAPIFTMPMNRVRYSG